jgi:hypothetical protein
MAKPTRETDREDLVIEDDVVVEETPATRTDGLPLAILIITTGCLLVAIILNLYHLGHTYKAGMLG